MNRTQFELKIIKDILKMGAAGVASIEDQLGLASEEFDSYRRHLINKGLANETTGNSGDYLLQPTSAGNALVRLIDSLDSVDALNNKKDERVRVKERLPITSSKRATTLKLLREGALRAYVLEQAEVTRVEAQLRYAEADEELISELAQHQLKLTWLRDFLDTLPHLFNDSRRRSR